MKQKVVFVASLSHSGSTLVDLLLGSHSRLAGLGEVDKVLHMDSAQLESEKVMWCSCGRRMAACPFWTPATLALQANPGLDLPGKYRLLFETFQQIYTPDIHLVDSSKYLNPLRTIISLPDVDLKVIHLIRDVRGFTVSQRDAILAKMQVHHLPTILGSVRFSRWVYLHSLKTSIYLFWKWYLRNLAVQRLLRERRVPSLQVGYDELAQHPETILDRMFTFLGLETPKALSLTPNLTNSHVFMGNPMLRDPEKMNRIVYDDRWKHRTDWRLAAGIFRNIISFNTKTVYSNLPPG